MQTPWLPQFFLNLLSRVTSRDHFGYPHQPIMMKCLDMSVFTLAAEFNLSALLQTIFFFCLFAFSWAAPAAYGGSQARGPIGAVAASLRQSHSNPQPHGSYSDLLTTVPWQEFLLQTILTIIHPIITEDKSTFCSSVFNLWWHKYMVSAFNKG